MSKLNIYYAIYLVAIGTGLQVGIPLGSPNTAELAIKDWIDKRASNDGKKNQIIFSLFVSMFPIGCLIGSMFTNFLATTFGRKKSLILMQVLIFISGPLFLVGYMSNSITVVMSARFVSGLCGGLSAAIGPMYMSEVSSKVNRGSNSTLFQLVITIGIVIGNLLGIDDVFGKVTTWHLIFMSTLPVAIGMFVLMARCPETPQYLLAVSKDEEKSKKAMKWFRGSDDIDAEFQEMKNEIEDSEKVQKATFIHLFTSPILSQPMWISLMLMLAQQFSGINAVISYSKSIFNKMTDDQSWVSFINICLMVFNVLMTIVSVLLIERLGRRTLLLLGHSGMGVCLMFLSLCISFKDVDKIVSYGAALFLFIFIAFFAVGPGPIPWLITSEIFPTEGRSKANTVATTINWFGAIVITILYPTFDELLGATIFLIFAIINFSFTLYIYKRVPETQGKSIAEVTKIWEEQAKSV